MRLRSTTAASFADPVLGKLNRSRSSKIQNNCVRVFTEDGDLEWLHELQPVQKKDGATICSALFAVLNGIVGAINRGLTTKIKGQTNVRVLHCIIGTDVQTIL